MKAHHHHSTLYYSNNFHEDNRRHAALFNKPRHSNPYQPFCLDVLP
jgi:anaerobic ribonucleoside-triphosphate reductase